jgi:hypothetical protein
MLHIVHGHYRPDAVTRTSVIEPWNIQKRNPVTMAERVLRAFTRNFTYPGPGLRQAAPRPTSQMTPGAVGNGSNGNGSAGAQPFYGKNMPQVPSTTPGAAGSFVVRDPNGNQVMQQTGANAIAPTDPLLRPVVQSTVMMAPMHNVYAVMREQYQALKSGSTWAQIRAAQNVARDYRRVTLPFKRGL